jgi:hypothetical protein
MNIALSIVRWLLALVIGAALGMWIFTATVNATVANREVVKNWLAKSGTYEKILEHSDKFVRPDEAKANGIVTAEDIKQAFAKTYDATYLKDSTNTVIDATYDWMDGTAQAIEFSIPVQEKSAEFSQNLMDQIMPKLLALPQCTGRIQTTTQITCLPPGVEPIDYAEQLTQQQFIKDPITHESLKDAFKEVPRTDLLPQAMVLIHILMWALPLASLVLGALYVAASPDKLRGIIHVARQLTISASITLVGGLFLWFASPSVNLATGVDEQQLAIANAVVNPLARTVLPDVGIALSLYSGLVVVIAGATWLGVAIWRHKRNSQPPTASGPSVPPPPTNAPESNLPTPLAMP